MKLPPEEMHEWIVGVARNSGNTLAELESAVASGEVPIDQKGLPVFGLWSGWRGRSGNAVAGAVVKPDRTSPPTPASQGIDKRDAVRASVAFQLGLNEEDPRR